MPGAEHQYWCINYTCYMKSKADLFHLIKAMSKSEKRYFTLDAQKTGKKGSKYLDLFQAINAMIDYDEAKLKKKFAKSLPSDKAYLYEAILSSMRDYRSSKSKVAQIKEMILDSNYLYERGLYDQCEERLDDAKALALELDEQLELLEINKLERILVWNKKESNYETQLDQLRTEKQISIQAIEEEFQYLDIYDQLSKEVIKRPDLDDPARKEEFNKNFKLLIDKDLALPNTPQALRKYYQCLALFYQLQANYEKVFEYYSLVVDWWEHNKKMRSEEFFRYIVDISNLLFICLRLKRYELFPGLIKQIEASTPNNQHDQRIVFKRLSLYKLVYFINSGESNGAKTLIAEIEEGIEKFKISIENNLPLIGNTAILAFILEDYPATCKWADQAIKLRKRDARQDVQRAMHILYLIATFELDNIDLTDNAIRLVQRNLAQRFEGKAGIFEKTIFEYIKKMHNGNVQQQQGILIELKETFESLMANTSTEIKKGTYGLDELIMHWIESKTTDISILEAIQDKQNKLQTANN